MRFWNFRNDADMTGDGVLDIDGEIVAEKGWFTSDGACVAKEFRQALKGMRNVTVHINSPGGDVMAGAEIYSALREHSLNGYGRITVIVTALAASAASVIAMAGDQILMHPVAYMMIHNPWTIAAGDAKELRKMARTLDVISEGLISAYQIRTGKTREELKNMLANTTWMSAGACVEEGFADGIYGAESGAAASLGRPTLMSARAHGLQEIAARLLTIGDLKEMEARQQRKAAEPDGEEPEKDPDEEEPEEEPEKEPEGEDPETQKREEIARRAEIAQRATIALLAMQ